MSESGIEIVGVLGEVQQAYSQFSQGVNSLTQQYIAPNIQALTDFNKALQAIKTTSKYFVTKPIDGEAIVKSLPKFDKRTRDKFKGLAEITKPFEELANALKGLGEMQSKAQTAAESMGRMVEHFEKIKKFALEINTSQKALNPENSGGAFRANADMTVFTSVGLLLETINSSVNNESLAKFKATADSLRTFTASLVDMITINKNFRQGLQAFMQNFTEAITDKDLREGNFQNTPFDKLGKLIQGFVNTFGLTGIKDIFDTITILSSDLKGFSGKEVEEGLRAVDAAGTKIAEFIEKLSKFGVRPEGNTTTETTLHKDGSVTEKFIPTLNAHVTAVKDILSTLSTLANDLKKLGEGETIRAGLDNIEKARTNINTFIDSLGSLGKRKEKTINKDGKNETVFVLNDKIQGVNIVLDALKILTGDLQSLSSNTDNALAALDLVKTELPKFIEGLGEFASLYTLTEPQEDGSVNKEYYFSNDKLRAFKALVEAMQPLTAVLSKLNVPDNFKAKVKKVGEAIRELATSFAPEKQEEGNALAFGVDNIKIIASALNSYGNAISKISLPKEALGDTGSIKTTAQNIYDLLDAFRTMDVQAGLDNMTVVSNVLAKYAGVLKSMSKIGAIDFSQIQTAFTELMTAINTLASSNSLKQLDDKDAERFGAIGRALKGISSFLNSVFKGGDFSGFTNNIQTAIPAITDFINAMSRLTQLSTFPDFERVAKAVGSFNGRLHDATKTIEHSSRAMTKLKSILRQIYTAFVGGAVVYSIVRGIKDAIKSMYDLEYAMARVNTIARVSTDTLRDMTHQVQEMSAKFGVESSKVSKALYDINSATIKGAASLKILEQSMALAVAGFTDVEKVSDLIAKAVNAYEYNANEAAKISDILFVTVERGINPMEELSEYFGRLFTVSANAGVSLEETAAGLATLTARGYQTNVASTALNSAILKISTGTKELNKLFNQYGYASSASALRTMGLAGAFQVLNKATGGSTEKLHDLGFNYRDIRAATTLASGAITEYNKTLELMNDKTYTSNKTSEALAKVQDTVKFKFDQLKQTYVVFVQSISEYLNKNELIKTLLSTLSEGIENLTKSMRGLSLSFSEQAKVGIATLIPKLVIALALMKPASKLFSGMLIGAQSIKAGFKSIGDSVVNATSKMRGMTDDLYIMSDASNTAKLSVDGTTYGFVKGFASAKASVTSTTTEINTLVSAINKIPVAVSEVNTAMKSMKFTATETFNRNNLMVNPKDSGVLKNLNTSLVGYGQIPVLKGFTVNPSVYKMATKSFGGLQVDPSYAYYHSGLGAVDDGYINHSGIAKSYQTFVHANPNAQNWSPFSASIQATTKDIGKLDVNTSNLSNTLNYSLNKVTAKFNDFNSGVNNLAKNLDVVKNVSNDVSVSLNSTFKANKGVFAPLAYSQGTPNIKSFSGTDILKKEWQSTNLSVNPTGGSYNGFVFKDAASGFDAVEESAKKATTWTQKFNASLKSFGGVAGSALKQFGAMYLQMAAINGVMSLFGDITTLINSGLSFGEFLEATFSLKSVLSFLPSAAGKFVDILTFGLTNLGERVSGWLNPPDYVDEKAVAKSRGYQGSSEAKERENSVAFRSSVVSIIKPFKELKENASKLGLSEQDIIEKYSEVNKQIDAEAKKRHISQEDLNYAHKAVDKIRDSLQDYNDVLNSLMPNTQALNDVFSSARKAIEDASEKHAGEMEKTIGKILDVQESLDVIAKGTGLSLEQIKSGVSSVANFDVLREMITAPFAELSQKITESIMPEVEKAFVDISAGGRREDIRKAYGDVVRNNTLLNSNIFREYNEMLGGKASFDKIVDAMIENSDFRGKVLDLSSMFGGENLTSAIGSYFTNAPSISELLEKPVDNIIEALAGSGNLSEEQIKNLKSQRDNIIKEWTSLSSSEYKTNSEFIAKMIADSISDPEIRKALDNLANNYIEVVKNTDKFRKSLVKLGTEIQDLASQNISVQDIVGNAFGLTSVAELKESLVTALYDPKALDSMKSGEANNLASNYAKIVVEGLKKNLSLDSILDELDDKLSKDAAFEGMDVNERRKKGKLFFDRVKGMVEFTAEATNKMAELDYTKFMNRLNFGGEISAFQQYKEIDSKRIASLMEREVIDGLKFADAFAEFNENVQNSDYVTAMKQFSTEHQGGLDIFLNMMKQYEGIFNGSASKLQNEYKQFNKRSEMFVEKYRDSLLTPIQKFEKVNDELNMQLKMIEMQSEQGNVSPELLNNTLQNMEELQKLNQEVMQMKVPSSITASEAVKTGSKEAFDLVATNIFRDMYKVNVQQSNYQKDMVNKLEQLVKKSDSSLQIVGYGG